MRHDEHYVEALAASAGAPIGRLVPIDRLDPNPNQPRQVMGDLSELMASIAEKGITEPLVVAARRPLPDRGGRAALPGGGQVGLRDLPVVIRDVDDTEMLGPR
jgi:ParB family chromosome partitioning protein